MSHIDTRHTITHNRRIMARQSTRWCLYDNASWIRLNSFECSFVIHSFYDVMLRSQLFSRHESGRSELKWPYPGGHVLCDRRVSNNTNYENIILWLLRIYVALSLVHRSSGSFVASSLHWNLVESYNCQLTILLPSATIFTCSVLILLLSDLFNSLSHFSHTVQYTGTWRSIRFNEIVAIECVY